MKWTSHVNSVLRLICVRCCIILLCLILEKKLSFDALTALFFWSIFAGTSCKLHSRKSQRHLQGGFERNINCESTGRFWYSYISSFVSNSPLDDANGFVIWENTNTGVPSSDFGGIHSGGNQLSFMYTRLANWSTIIIWIQYETELSQYVEYQTNKYIVFPLKYLGRSNTFRDSMPLLPTYK